MRLLGAWIGNNGRPLDTPGGRRWQVRWKLDTGGRRDRERKRSDFRTKGDATAFIALLHRADLRVDGWRFDDDGNPVERPEVATTVLDALEDYVAARFYAVWKPASRDKVRGTLCQLVALNLTDRSDASALLDAWAAQRNGRRPRPDPTSEVDWAARWLRDHALVPHATVTDPRVEAGRAWIAARSMPLSALDDRSIPRLQSHFCDGRVYSTARTYWQGTVVPFLNWLVETRRITHAPLAGHRKMRRDVAAERPDRRQVFEPDELALVAKYLGDTHGEQWDLWALTSAYCALRIGESVALRCDWFHRSDSGRLYLNPHNQEQNHTRLASDDGTTTSRVGATKSRFGASPTPRNIPIPTHLARRLEAFYGDDLCRTDRRLFVGPRGGAASKETLRKWWHAAIPAALGEHHHLVGRCPHSLRHTGMTYWFAAGIDHNRIRVWGGWKSLKEMLDTYCGILASLEAEQHDDLDAFHDRWLPAAPPPALTRADPAVVPIATADEVDRIAEVVDLAALRRRRERRLAR